MVAMHETNLNTALICRNVTVSGRRTSIRMEQVMWTSLTDICRREDHTVNEIISIIDEKRAETNLTAAIRVFIICYYRDAALSNGAKCGFAEEASTRWPNRDHGSDRTQRLDECGIGYR